MNKNIKFTFVLPVHNGMSNGKNYIKEQVESIINQEYKNWNLIILENMSNDGTLEYLNTLSDSRISIERSDKFLTLEENWKRILKTHREDYTIIAMADDKYDQNYLNEIVDLIHKYPNANVYRTNLNIIDENSNIIGKSTIKETISFLEYMEGRLCHTYFETFQGYCFKTSFYDKTGGFECVNKGFYMDDKIVLTAIGETLMPVSPSHVCYYRTHKNSCSGSPDIVLDLINYKYFFEWLKSLKNKNLDFIIKKYLPYHIKCCSHFYTENQIREYKEIYKLYSINENDLLHKWINYKLKHNPSFKSFLQGIFSIKNEYKNDIKRKVIKFLGIKMTFKCYKKGVNQNDY